MMRAVAQFLRHSFSGSAFGAAAGWGDVDSDNAMVLDLGGETLSSSTALGCIKDDFAGQGPGGGEVTVVGITLTRITPATVVRESFSHFRTANHRSH